MDAWLAWPCQGLTMRRILLIVAVVTTCGCAGTVDAQRVGQRSGGSAHTIPVVTEQPKLAERLRLTRQREAEQLSTALTEIRGSITQ